MPRGFLILLAFLAAVFFFALATLKVSFAAIPEVPAGLLCCAIAFVLQAVEGWPYAGT